MNQFIQILKNQFNEGKMHVRILFLNAAIFLVMLIVSVLFSAFSLPVDVSYYMAAPSAFSDMIFQPWSLVTYMFTHSLTSIWHIVFNMIMLYFAGNLFVHYLGSKKLLSVYLVGGFVGYLFYSLGYSFLPAFSSMNSGMLVGASASVLAVFVALGVYKPNLELKLMFIPQPIKLIYMVGIFIVLDLMRLQSSMGVPGGNAGGWLAHLGGTAFGILYGLKAREGKNILRKFEHWLDSIFSISFERFFQKRKPKLKVKKGGKQKQTKSAPNVNPKPENSPNMEVILDKVKQSGYGSLTQKEKEILFSQTKK